MVKIEMMRLKQMKTLIILKVMMMMNLLMIKVELLIKETTVEGDMLTVVNIWQGGFSKLYKEDIFHRSDLLPPKT